MAAVVKPDVFEPRPLAYQTPLAVDQAQAFARFQTVGRFQRLWNYIFQLISPTLCNQTESFRVTTSAHPGGRGRIFLENPVLSSMPVVMLQHPRI